MAQIIRIKRSATTATPSTLQEGELAYSELSDNLFIGTNAGASVEKIGGAADVTKLAGIEAGADVTDATNVNAAGAVMESDFNANTILSADTDNTPAPLNLPEGTMLGRLSGGNIDALTTTEVRTLLNVEDGAAADQNASQVPFTPYGNIGTTDVQAAIQELDDEKLSLNGGTMTGNLTLAGNPTGALHAAPKQYVDSVAQGIDAKDSVKVATTGPITLSGTQSIDGISCVGGDRVLVRAQSAAEDNGIYLVAAGSWSRAPDADSWDEHVSAFVFVEQGSTYADTGWVCQADSGGTLGSSAINWTQFSGAGSYMADGIGIELSGTTFSLELDGSTLSKSASGLKVASGGVTNTEINASASIAFSKMAALTASRALVSDGSGVVDVSSVTATELGYVSGVTSDIQTQIDGKIGDITGEDLQDLNNVSMSPGGGTNGYVVYWNNGGPSFQLKAQVFTDNTDTPASYSGQGGKLVAVNSGATALEFVNEIDGGTF